MSSIYKIFLAVGHKGLEDFLKSKKKALEKNLNSSVMFVGETVYREGIIQGVTDYKPDVILIREGLQGNANLTEIIYKLKVNFPQTRIIFIAGDREPGDAFLATLIQYGVYDLLVGSKVNVVDMLKRIVKPNNISHVAHFMPKITIDESTNSKTFDAPDLTPIKREDDIQIVNEPDVIVNNTIKKREAIDVNTNAPNLKEKAVINDAEPQEANIESTKNNVNSKEDINKKVEELARIKKPIISNDVSKIEDTTSDDDELLIIDDIPEKCNEEVKKVDKPTEINNPSIIQKKKPVQIEAHSEKEIPISNQIKKPKIQTNKNSIHSEDELIINQKTPLKETVSSRVIENTPNENKKVGFFGKILGSKKEMPKRINQQIITFIGGKAGTGNSQLAFNTALHLAQNGFKVMYLDLNDKESTIDSILQLGYRDVGIDTALRGVENGDFNLIERSICNIDKILPETEKENYLYKTYAKFPKNFDYMFFSQEYMERIEDKTDINFTYLKDLNMYLTMSNGYDVIIIDAQSDIRNKLTELSLIYSNKIFFTLTQDYSVIANHLNQIKLMDRNGINFREKFYYLVNKFENADLSIKDVYKIIAETLRMESFDMSSIPNFNKELINSNYLGQPLLWNIKNKEIYKSFSEIERLIMK